MCAVTLFDPDTIIWFFCWLTVAWLWIWDSIWIYGDSAIVPGHPLEIVNKFVKFGVCSFFTRPPLPVHFKMATRKTEQTPSEAQSLAQMIGLLHQQQAAAAAAAAQQLQHMQAAIAQQQAAAAEQLRLVQEASEQRQASVMKALEAVSLAVSARSPPPFTIFRPDNEQWSDYIERFEQHVTCHGVTAEQTKKAFFLSNVGSTVINLLKKLFPDREISEIKWAEIRAALDKNFLQTPHVVAARYAFFQLRKREGQTHSDWITDLVGSARACQFRCRETNCGASYADTLIRDMVILHTPSEAVRKEAIRETNPTLEQVRKIAALHELTEDTSRRLTGGAQVAQLRSRSNTRTEEGKGRASRDSSRHESSGDDDSSDDRGGGTPRAHRRGRSSDYDYSSDDRGGGTPKARRHGRPREGGFGGGGHRDGDSRSGSKGQRKDRSEAGKGHGERNQQLRSCRDCGWRHSREFCRFRKADCYHCGKSGHIREVCRSARGQYKVVKDKEEAMDVDHLHAVLDARGRSKIIVKIFLAGVPVEFLLDSGAAATLVNLDTYHKLGTPECVGAEKKLSAYGKTPISLLGKFEVQATYKRRKANLEVMVVDRYDVMNILGLDSFSKLGFGVVDHLNAISEQSTSETLEELQRDFPEVFQDGLGECNSFKAHLKLKDNCKPRFFKARSVPWALKDKVEAELKRWEAQGVITRVSTSRWATPLVLVKKQSGAVRLCGDFKCTVNEQLEVEQYPIPRPEDLFQKLAGGQSFSKIDLRDAYLQIPLDDQAREILVINTPLGLFRFNRLPFGVNSAAALFQRCLEQLTAQLPGCVNYLDDIIVTGATMEEHRQNLRKLMEVLGQNGLKVNRNKCEFFREEVVFLGHVLTKAGIAPTQQHIRAIVDLPAPQDVKQLQAVVGKINYYNKFIKGFSSIAAPLNALKKKGVKFQWTAECQAAFDKLKKAIAGATQLSHFVPGRVTSVATDASDYGLGAVLSQKDEQGVERPIAFASKSLNKHQRNYSQIEKEALSLVFGVRKFNDFLYGAKFHLITDHKPLVHLFHPGKKLPEGTVKKLQRWALFLSDYNYSIHFRPTTQHGNADALSRLPVGPDVEFDAGEEECLQLDLEELQRVEEFPVGAKVVAEETQKDPELKQVLEYVRNGWPARQLRSNAKWWSRKDRLTVKAGVLLLSTEEASRVVVPRSLRQQVLKLLHEGHWGLVRTKQLARRYCFWDGMSQDIVDLVRRCEPCQVNQAAPKKDLVSWPTPRGPWERVHADFAGPFWGSMWLLVVDSFSNFPFAVEMRSTTAAATIDALEKIFVAEGLPETLVTDNGTQFTSGDFQRFCRDNGVLHICAPPFHPQSNGEAERFVRTFKTAMGKARAAGTSKDRALLRVLASYRALPGRDGKSPAEWLHGRQPRTLLSLLRPGDGWVSQGAPPRFKEGDKVYCTSFKADPAWVPGVVHKVHGSRLYEVRTLHKTLWRHQGQVRPRFQAAEVDSYNPRPEEEYRRAVLRQFAHGTYLQGADRQGQSQPAPVAGRDVRREAAAQGLRGSIKETPPAGRSPAGEQQATTSGVQRPHRELRRRVRFAPYASHLGAEGVVATKD